MGQLHEAYNLCVTGVPEKMERTEEIFETIMTEHFPKSIAGANPQIQEAQRIPSRINAENKTLHRGMANANCRKLKIKKKS